MTRTRASRARHLRIAGVTAAGAMLLAGGGYAFTGATFTDSETIKGNTVKAATLAIGYGQNTQSYGTTVTFDKLVPGDTADAKEVLNFTNGGDVPFTYTVTINNVTTVRGPQDSSGEGQASLPGWIPVTLSSNGKSAKGTLAAPPVLTVDGSVEPGEGRKASLTVGLSSDADDKAQGASATFDVVVTASQASATKP